MKNTKTELLEAMDDGTVAENVLTVGRLIKRLFQYQPNIPVEFVDCTNGHEELMPVALGAASDDNDAWYDDFEVPENANRFEILTIKKSLMNKHLLL